VRIGDQNVLLVVAWSTGAGDKPLVVVASAPIPERPARGALAAELIHPACAPGGHHEHTAWGSGPSVRVACLRRILWPSERSKLFHRRAGFCRSDALGLCG
jgi:hypothetical protein